MLRWGLVGGVSERLGWGWRCNVEVGEVGGSVGEVGVEVDEVGGRVG